ncbi:MAG TPA: sugar phosphate isomerase/epimerase family protein [Bryobacteraceae bacterium]|nr:sugar phosphate isomerase/epimerase family protein [Bryobacteraceae bacterium]
MPILHSISYSGSWGQQFLTVEEFIDKAADLGFDGVMLAAKRPHLSVLDWPAESRRRLRERIERRRLSTICIAGYTNFTADLEHADIPNAELQIRHVIEMAEMAHDLGGSLVRVFTAYENPAASYAAQWNLVVKSLREAARRSADYGVTVAVQNHHDIAVDYESQYELIREVGEPNCRAVFDAWAPALQGVDIIAAAKKMGSIAVQTIIANYQLRPRYRYAPALVNYERLIPTVQAVPVDEGFIDYRAFLSALREGGFDGVIAYEMCSPLRGGGSMENLDAYARRFLKWLTGTAADASSQLTSAIHRPHPAATS